MVATGNAKRSARRREYRAWRKSCHSILTPGPLGKDPVCRAQPKKAAAFQDKTAAIFRRTVLFHKYLPDLHTPWPLQRSTTPALPYGSRIRIGTLNVQGFAVSLKLHQAKQIMQLNGLSLLLLTETRSTSYHSYLSDHHLIILSGSQTDKYGGVGAIVHPALRSHLLNVNQVSPRIIVLTFAAKAGRQHYVGAYAPHAGHSTEEMRRPFWDQLNSVLSSFPQPEPYFVMGDLNVRLQGRFTDETAFLGQHILGKGWQYADRKIDSNRSMFLALLRSQDALDIQTFRTPQLARQITYRDKCAPPANWSQYMLDPLIMQQFYSLLAGRFSNTLALSLAARIRAFVTNEPALPPLPSSPSPDPIRFQCLDKLLVARKWQSAVLSCRSLLTAGFPSDHYPLVAEVRVKLGRRMQRVPARTRFDYPFSPTRVAEKSAYNAAVRHIAQPIIRSEASSSSLSPAVHYEAYTDGSGTAGHATPSTKAGWGWLFFPTDISVPAHEAYGPVVTSSDHPAYVGASVGSNNAGELTALIELLMWLIASNFQGTCSIYTDSQWARNAILTVSRPKRHAALILVARQLYTHLQARAAIHIIWTKGHAGNWGNDRADWLAAQGKRSTVAHGGRHALIPVPSLDALLCPSAISPPTSQSFAKQILQAAYATLSPIARTPRRPWISIGTLTQLDNAKSLLAQGDTEGPAALRIARSMARKDKRAWIHQRLMTNPSLAHTELWRQTRQLRRGFQERNVRLEINGQPVPWSRTHEIFSNHLANTQWAPPSRPPDHYAFLQGRAVLRETFPSEGPITHEELYIALAKLRKGKAPGPDSITSEMLLLLDQTGEETLLQLFNNVWSSRTLPPEWAQAIIVSFYKGKGSSADPANYRPISLLNTLYKLFVSILQARIARSADHFIRKTQYGFRAHRSTGQPIFLVRRLMDWSVSTGTTVHLLFLDWKQAFDKVDHSALLIALRRFGLSEHMLAIVASIYDRPTFLIKGMNGQSSTGTVGSGIRQGCPLSPYLFIILLSVIMHDVEDALIRTGVPQNVWSVGRPIFDVEYADDMLVMAITTPQCEHFLHAIEKEAAHYGLALNQTKTCLLRHPNMTGQGVKFLDGAVVPLVSSVKYLGTQISWEHTETTAIGARLIVAEQAYQQLRLIWNSPLSTHTKQRLFSSIFVPILLYGLEHLNLTHKHLQRIDSIYFRFLRRVMRIKHSYYSRISNFEVWVRAGRPMQPSFILQHRQYKQLLTLLHSTPDDPLHNIVFCSAFRDRLQYNPKARGRPKPYWLQIVGEQAVNILQLYHKYDAWEYSLDIKGIKRIIDRHPDFQHHLLAAPTRAWQQLRAGRGLKKKKTLCNNDV